MDILEQELPFLRWQSLPRATAPGPGCKVPPCITSALYQSCQHGSQNLSQIPGLPPCRQRVCPGGSALPRDRQSQKNSEKWKSCSRSSQPPLISPFSLVLRGADSFQLFRSSGDNDLIGKMCVQSKPSADPGDGFGAPFPRGIHP